MNLKKSVIALSSLAIASYAQADTSLQNILVSATHTPISAQAVTADYEVISAAEIAEKNYKTLDQALTSIAGISIVRNGGLGTTTSLFIRGQSNNAALVLVDGVEMNNPLGTGGAILSNILLTDIDAIEVIKGPQSGIWGANASSGVINIITRQAKMGTQIRANVELGSNNTQRLFTSFSEKTAEGDFVASFSTLNSDGFSAVKQAGKSVHNFEDDAFRQTDFSLNAGMNIDSKKRVEILVKRANSTAHYDYANNPDQTDFASVDYENNLSRIQYLQRFDQLNLTAYAAQNNVKQFNDAFINSLGIKGGYQYADQQNLSFVLEKKQYENNSTRDRYHNIGLGLTNTNQLLNNKLILTQAIRTDEYSDFENKVTGKFGIKTLLSNNSYLKANVGTAYNAPTLFQTTYGATSKLNPEETQSFDIGFGLYGLQVSYYESKTKDLIQYGGFWPNDFYYNLSGTSKFKGLEASYSHFFEAIDSSLRLAYTKASAKDDNDQWLARRAQSTFNIGWVFDGIDKLTLGVDSRYQGKTYDKADQQGAQIGEYWVTDINFNYQVNKYTTVYANVLNAFAEDYTQAVATYKNFDDSQPAQNVYSNGGRQFFLGVRAALN